MNSATILSLYRIWLKVLEQLQHIFLLAIRLLWGWSFVQTGSGKFTHLERTVNFFTSLNIPFPEANAIIASGTELVGGICLILGLGSRIVTVPLLFTMMIAYSTAHREELLNVFNDPDAFMSAPPFLFAYAVIIVLLFGAGKYSLDRVIYKKFFKNN